MYILSCSIAVNKFPYMPQLMNKVASSGGTFTIPKGTRCSGTKSFWQSVPGDDVVESMSVDEAYAQYGAVYLMHMDVEGAEVLVLESASTALKHVENFIVEVNPGRWSKYGITREHGLRVFASLHEFECRDLASKARHPLLMPVIQNLADAVAAIKDETDYWCTRMKGLHVRVQPAQTRIWGGPDVVVRPGF